jgi:hypothetical protein
VLIMQQRKSDKELLSISASLGTIRRAFRALARARLCVERITGRLLQPAAPGADHRFHFGCGLAAAAVHVVAQLPLLLFRQGFALGELVR